MFNYNYNTYQKQLRRNIQRVSNSNIPTIKNELRLLQRNPYISMHEKHYIKSNIYRNMNQTKKRKLRNFFGQTATATPTTVAAPTTVAPTTVAPTTVAPTTVAPTTVAPTTVAPVTLAQQAPATLAQAAALQQQNTTSTIVQPQSYNQIASAVQGLEAAAGQLLQTAAAQNISG